MMTPDHVYSAVALVAAVAAFLAAIQFVYVPTLTAEYRAKLFEIRRDLFLMLAAGEIAGTHPAYHRLRALLNGLLSTAEGLTGTYLVTMSLVSRWLAPFDGDGIILSKIEDQIVAAKIGELRTRVAATIVQHIQAVLPTSPLLFVFMIFMTVRFALGRMAGAEARAMKRIASRLQAEAAEVGEQRAEECAQAA